MQNGKVTYGVQGRQDYAFGALLDEDLFAIGADVDRALGHIVQDGEGRIKPDELPDLPLVDYEFLQAHFCIANFGDQISRNLTCSDCQKSFAVSFSLKAFVKAFLDEMTIETSYAFEGATFRLPTRAAIERLQNQDTGFVEVLCDDPCDPTAFEAHLAAVCPVFAEDIKADCPRCGTAHSYAFNLRQHLTDKLQTRLRNIVAEIHILAVRYHWTAKDILALSRVSRRALIETIQRQSQQASAR